MLVVLLRLMEQMAANRISAPLLPMVAVKARRLVARILEVLAARLLQPILHAVVEAAMLAALEVYRRRREDFRARRRDSQIPMQEQLAMAAHQVARLSVVILAAAVAAIACMASVEMAATAAVLRVLLAAITAAVAVVAAQTAVARAALAAQAQVVTLLLRSLCSHETLGFNQKQCC